MITFIEAFKKEFEAEAIQTRRMLEIVPNDKFDWRPHPKSMDIKTLATHLAELPLMIVMGLKHDKWDFANSPYPSKECNNTQDLLARLEESIVEVRIALDESTDDILQDKWEMCSGDQVWLTLEKWETFRHAMGQNAHHRAQLQVYLRLLDIPVPGPYGPSADEM
ncbi:DinB family protein [Lacihabitans sp. LS3-19]|uniref:DinB family protein n=1 Tax=Lacihabitans sp. LS3-19 TaxID=2487335 RepID=UPI0020CC1753|nr:DinB family protein [Lacihabitans sp. LS3-19]